MTLKLTKTGRRSAILDLRHHASATINDLLTLTRQTNFKLYKCMQEESCEYAKEWTLFLIETEALITQRIIFALLHCIFMRVCQQLVPHILSEVPNT